jgi:hypothetical protein
MLAALLLMAATSQVQDLAAGLRHCASVSDTLQRLVCYDDLAKQVASLANAAPDRSTRGEPSGGRLLIEANEAKIVAFIRLLISAQAAYHSANGGWFEGSLPCLSNPWSGCIPNYPRTAPRFLAKEQTSLQTLNGYVPEFLPGPPSASNPRVCSPTAVTQYAYRVVPEVPGVTGVRSFCGDSSAIICYRADGAPPAVFNGTCDLSACRPLGPGD